MSDFVLNPEGDFDRLIIEGDLTVDRAAEFKNALLSAIGSGSDLVLDLCGVGEVSVAALQLLCSAHRTARTAGRKLRLAACCSETLVKAVADNGFNRHTGCPQGRGECCLWVKGE